MNEEQKKYPCELDKIIERLREYPHCPEKAIPPSKITEDMKSFATFYQSIWFGYCNNGVGYHELDTSESRREFLNSMQDKLAKQYIGFSDSCVNEIIIAEINSMPNDGENENRNWSESTEIYYIVTLFRLIENYDE